MLFRQIQNAVHTVHAVNDAVPAKGAEHACLASIALQLQRELLSTADNRLSTQSSGRQAKEQ